MTPSAMSLVISICNKFMSVTTVKIVPVVSDPPCTNTCTSNTVTDSTTLEQ